MRTKIYTEEQIRKGLTTKNNILPIDLFLEKMTPIELPTDDEIEEFSHTKYMEVEDSRWFEPLKVGAKWMRDKIGGNK